METIRSVFADKLMHDDRNPILTFRIYGLDGQYALYPPKAGLWNQLIATILIQLLFQMIFAFVVYRLIVQQRGKAASKTGLYLIGYGLIIPLALYIPFPLMEFVQVQNKIIKLGFTTLPMIVCFRTVEAMHGTSPAVVEKSLGTYLVYYSTVSHFEWDETKGERRKITARELMTAFLRISYFFVAVSLWLSFMTHVNFNPAKSTVPLDSFHIGWDLLSPAHLLNAYCLAILTYFVLATGFEMTTFGEQVKGYATKPIFDNPLFTSRTLRQFWGQKWNSMIQRVLRYGAYLPARQAFADSGKNVSNLIATLVTFLASGIMHEYVWLVIFFQMGSDGEEAQGGTKADSFFPFKLTLFFLYNGLTFLIEHKFGHHITWFHSWPSIIVSTGLILTALPVSHWFTGDWVLGGFFSDFVVGLWHIKKVD